MVIIKIQYGLGNQLFMYAAARCQAHKLNTELKIDKSYYDKENLISIEKYKLSEFNIPDNFATAEEIENPGPNDVYIDNGLFQKDIFFKEIDDIIRQEFTLRNPVGEKTAYWRDKISAAECPVALHIRHGEYSDDFRFRVLFGVLPLEYYRDAVNRLKSDGENFTLFVFSDDLAWAKENLDFGVPMEFVEGCEKDVEEIYLMSLCRHNIIANSTFSWWGAWLNPNPDKKVFAPSPWFRNATISGSPDGIIPDEWIKLPSYFDRKSNTETTPLLSIILYVKNDAQRALSSILSQSLREYEIIVIDASTNSSGNFCRQFVGRENINFVKVKASTGKAAAWNKGLELARGDYVMFFSSEDFLVSQAVYMLFQVWYSGFQKFESERKNIYTGYFDYRNVASNLICATQRIAEDDAGTLTINGLPDRKFTVTVDAPFQNLKAITELEIASAQKLILLGTNQLNNLIGTKFFRRDFLNENKIRFDENLSADAELKFLVDAFLGTEKITFMPQVFYGRLN